jgi:hypothetical protein
VKSTAVMGSGTMDGTEQPDTVLAPVEGTHPRSEHVPAEGQPSGERRLDPHGPFHPPPVRGRGVHAVRSDRDTTGLMLEDQLRVETSLDVQSAKRPRHQRRGTGLRYRGLWHLPGPDSHRLASVSLSLGYAS